MFNEVRLYLPEPENYQETCLFSVDFGVRDSASELLTPYTEFKVQSGKKIPFCHLSGLGVDLYCLFYDKDLIFLK